MLRRNGSTLFYVDTRSGAHLSPEEAMRQGVPNVIAQALDKSGSIEVPADVTAANRIERLFSTQIQQSMVRNARDDAALRSELNCRKII